MKAPRETADVAAGVRRMVASLGRRIGDEDPVDLAHLVELRDLVDQVLADAIAAQHADRPGRPGFSLAELAAGLGTTRQAVGQRLARRAARLAKSGDGAA